MSKFKQYDQKYQNQKKIDYNYDDPKWCAIVELEARLSTLEIILNAQREGSPPFAGHASNLDKEADGKVPNRRTE